MGKIYLATNETFATLELAHRHYRINTQRAISIDLMDWLAEGYGDYVTPEIPAGYKLGNNRIDLGAGRYSWQVVPKTADEVATERTENAQRIAAAGKAYIMAQIDPDGLILVERLVNAGHLYGIKNSEWGIAVRLEQKRREAVVEAGVEDFTPEMLDFSLFGEKPYTVEQMMMAAGLSVSAPQGG